MVPGSVARSETQLLPPGLLVGRSFGARNHPFVPGFPFYSNPVYGSAISIADTEPAAVGGERQTRRNGGRSFVPPFFHAASQADARRSRAAAAPSRVVHARRGAAADAAYQ